MPLNPARPVAVHAKPVFETIRDVESEVGERIAGAELEPPASTHAQLWPRRQP
jgi:hypothetical protein